ncbi:hypothetical protein [Devosia riboflavina]
MTKTVDVAAEIDAAIEDHLSTHHRKGTPVAMMPVRPFSARLALSWQEEGTDPNCRVFGLTPFGDFEDDDGMPMMAFIVMAKDSSGSLVARVVPELVGDLPGV